MTAHTLPPPPGGGLCIIHKEPGQLVEADLDSFQDQGGIIDHFNYSQGRTDFILTFVNG